VIFFSFYDKFVQLCAERNLKPTKVGEEMHLGKGAISNWKRRKNDPTDVVIAKVCNYFEVPLDYFETENEHSQKVKLQENARNDLKLLFDMAKDASPEDVQKAIAFFEVLKNGNNH